MTGAILALNAGSSSIKFALFGVGDAQRLTRLAKGQIDGDPDDAAAVGQMLDWTQAHLGAAALAAVGHRVVHGGRDFTAPALLTADVVRQLDRLTPLAPLHQPHSLAPIRRLMQLRPGLPQVACFDTAFHATLPPVATRFALPREYADEGVRRYGFHGLSYEYIARALRRTAPGLADGRVVVAHLGNGASLCAMQNGISVDTTMGFTALDGLVMGTRCGTIDPGVVLYMLQQKGLSAAEAEQVLYKKSGLLGVSGLSKDMRELVASDDPHAREAVELFVFRIARETAAIAATMGGLDGFVFTAGIGEHAAEVRAMVCERLAWLGARLDRVANAGHAARIDAPDSRVQLHVIPTDEEAMIAQHAIDCIGA